MRQTEFDRRWDEAAKPGASASLSDLLHGFFEEFTRQRLDLAALRGALIGVLEYLCSVEGGTDDNFYSADAFLCVLTVERDDLLDRLAPEYRSVIDAMSLDLYEAYRDPEMAERMEATLEILLARARGLDMGVVH